MPTDQKIKGFHEKLHGRRENTTFLFGSKEPMTNPSTRRKKPVENTNNDSKGSLVDNLIQCSKAKNIEKMQNAMLHNQQRQEIARQRQEEEEKLRKQKEQDQWYYTMLETRPTERAPPKPIENVEEDENESGMVFGRPGAGAPLRDNQGNLVTARKTDPLLRMNNIHAATNQSDKLKRLELMNENNNMATENQSDSLFGNAKQTSIIDQLGRGMGAGNAQRTSSGRVKRFKQANPQTGIHCSEDLDVGVGLNTRSKYGGGGGEPVYDEGGNPRTTTKQFFKKDATGNALTKSGEAFNSGGNEDSMPQLEKTDTFASFRHGNVQSADYRRLDTDSPLEKQARAREQRKLNDKQIAEMLHK